jgi:hypothetical protein
VKVIYFSYKWKSVAFFQDFNVVDTSDNQVFIAVDHEEDIANLYLSDVTGQFYVTSVENVVGMRYPGKFDVDLVKVCQLIPKSTARPASTSVQSNQALYCVLTN